jgi:transposase
MSNRRYSDEFKKAAVKQVIERGYSVNDVSKRLDISIKSLYVWLKESRGGKGKEDSLAMDDVRRENARLKSELKRVEEERDILKKAAAYFARTSV